MPKVMKLHPHFQTGIFLNKLSVVIISLNTSKVVIDYTKIWERSEVFQSKLAVDFLQKLAYKSITSDYTIYYRVPNKMSLAS